MWYRLPSSIHHRKNVFTPPCFQGGKCPFLALVYSPNRAWLWVRLSSKICPVSWMSRQWCGEEKRNHFWWFQWPAKSQTTWLAMWLELSLSRVWDSILLASYCTSLDADGRHEQEMKGFITHSKSSSRSVRCSPGFPELRFPWGWWMGPGRMQAQLHAQWFVSRVCAINTDLGVPADLKWGASKLDFGTEGDILSFPKLVHCLNNP